MVEKIKTEVDRVLLVLNMKKNFPIYFTKIELFLNFETESSLSIPVLPYIPFFKFWKENFIYFKHKHVET